MDDIYEFENSEYRVATIQIKAIAYDVITKITKQQKNQAISEDTKKELTTISNNLIELTDSLEEEFKKLDQIGEGKSQEGQPKISLSNHFQPAPTRPKEESVDTQKIKIDLPEPTPQPEEAPKKEENESQNITNNEEKEPPTIPNDVEKGQFVIPLSAFKNASTKHQESQEEITQSETKAKVEEPISQPQINQQPELPDLADVKIKEENAEEETSQEEPSQQLQPATVEETSVTKEPTPKKFQKTTKNLSKAIMVKQSQLENLRSSRKYQEQLLAKLGIFELVKEAEIAENPISQVQKELPEEVERQIEDLTVKANIYYNEGQTDQAQELYDKIKELNEQYR